MVSSTPNREAFVFLRNTYTSSREVDKIDSSKWAVEPGVIHAYPGETVHWTVLDSSNRNIDLRDIQGVFDGPVTTSGNQASAKISAKAKLGHYYEYRFFWGNDEAQGGSAPGVIIE